MLSLLAVNFEPQLRGIIIVAIAVGVLIGGTYLVVGTNLGARLGFLVVLAGLFGWMAIMGSIWWTYGIGLKGREPSWQPGEPTTIVRSSDLLDDAEIMLTPMQPSGDAVADAAAASTALQSEGWMLLQESDPRRGQAVASADEIIQKEAEEFALGEYVSVAVYDKGGDRWPKINESLDFVAFFHEPHYSIVEVAPIVPQRVEPGRAPARPVIDETQSHRYVYMLRDLGSKRQPAIFITIGSLIIFLLLCRLLHVRDLRLRENLTADSGSRSSAKS
ncbi:MAG: hypothetical protein EB028_04425 [Actinobacteria bacterium]|nr:hypothetical protein [Acidimicrobiia bacterium]NCU86569.1 hypothetical protein [Actinomycetota bacterium]NDB27168.1 hypothetical protein [Actinomycetota bacterium]